MSIDLNIEHLGRISYADAYARQQEINAAVLNESAPPTALILEHDPVITIPRRPTAADNLIVNQQILQQQGIEVQKTNRGGDITYHGPGQLVVYPIIPLNALKMNVRSYVCMLEQSIIDTIAIYGITGKRDESAIGVWVDEVPGQLKVTGGAKIAAVGIRVRRWITMHGFALNITTNLDHFKNIVPCGLTGRPVTSMQQMLADKCPTIEQVSNIWIENFKRLLVERAPSE